MEEDGESRNEEHVIYVSWDSCVIESLVGQQRGGTRIQSRRCMGIETNKVHSLPLSGMLGDHGYKQQQGHATRTAIKISSPYGGGGDAGK